ncbi:MAG: nitrous oxide reductase family maturation protein NosD [Rhodobacteraceae bacterium]|nr:nitrous oxide reductase family maturation protein NosD [Paracoccaceae bacterium]
MIRALAFFILLFPALAGAEEVAVPPEAGALVMATENAGAGDILRLSENALYIGAIEISVPLTIIGNGATIDGQGTGSVITVTAENVTLRDLTVIGSGSGGNGLDAGITLSKTAHGAVVEENTLIGNLVGIDVHGANNALIARNYIEGRQGKRMNDRGNGIYIWNAPGTRVIGNDVRYGRDGLFVNVSRDNEFIGNRFRDLRFAVHYMYANNSTVSGNISEGNHLGYAIMYSNNVQIEGNLSRNDRNHGIMMNYTNRSEVRNNTIEQVEDKCVFIYNAHRNSFSGNVFAGCGIGIHFTAGSERNALSGNAFIGNRTQVKYVGSKWVEWSREGRGNYWSDHSAFDLDANGIADSAYRPNDIMDQILWRQPAAKSLLGSPAVQLIRWSQSAFPAMLPGGVIDSFPLMAPLLPAIPQWPATAQRTD